MGSASAAGVDVTDGTMMGLPAVYACVRAQAEVIAQMPIKLMRRLPEGGATTERDHPLHELIATRPNNYQTHFEFVRLMQARLAIRHNAFAKIEGNASQSMRLLPVHPGLVSVRGDERTGNVAYDIHWPDGVERDIPAPRMLHIRGFSDSGFLGWAPSVVLKDALGAAISVDRYGQRMMARGLHIQGFLRTAGLSRQQEQNLERELAESSGPNNAGGVKVLGGTSEWIKMGMTAREAEMLGTRRLMVEDVARMFRMPPHVIGHMDQMTRSNMEEQNREFLDYSIMPWIIAWQERLSFSLLQPSERRAGLFFRFEVGGLLRANFRDRFEAYARAFWMTPNEIRSLEDMPRMEGLDDIRLPLNMEPVT